ncbi:MAG: hypothetical protein SFY69_11910 [Planctomycetota bacterium]|nr:hypothetical protein [Planctomycetota bacterium]
MNRSSRLGCVVGFVLAGAAVQARASMLNLSRYSYVTVSTYGGSANPGSFSETQETNSLDPWSAAIQSTAGASGRASQFSWVNESMFFIDGWSSIGGGAGHGGGQTPTEIRVNFDLIHVHTFTFSSTVSEAWFGYGYFKLSYFGGADIVNFATDRNETVSGVIGPGSYQASIRFQSGSMMGFIGGTGQFEVAVVPSVGTTGLLLMGTLTALRRRR